MDILTKVYKFNFVFLLIFSFLLTSCEEEDDGRILVTEVNHCSKLDLSGIKWPDELSEVEIDIYSLAFNITGSFEGSNLTWNNMSNNFDGQGLSLGIFQQNLGQGSLQPLLNKVQRNHSNIFGEYFSQLERASLSGMLNAWSDRRSFTLASARAPASEDEYITLESIEQFSSPTDIVMDGEFFQQNSISLQASNSVNQYSVDWALQNLYMSNKRTFKSNWKTAFKNLAKDPRYVSLQVEKANSLHRKAMKFMELYEARELRSYLFFFDIVVQNGGINSETRNDYLEDIEGEDLTENERMRVLFEHRVLRSKKRWRADVRSRKITILDGSGLVHGRSFNKLSAYSASSLLDDAISVEVPL